MNIHDHFYNHPDKELQEQWIGHVIEIAKLKAENHMLRDDKKIFGFLCSVLACCCGLLLAIATN